MASLVAWLAYGGARKADGTTVASGSAYFYQPGTTNTQVTAYSDRDGLTPTSQPVALNAAGQATVFLKVAARVVVLDSTGAQVQLQDRANTIAAPQVEVEQPAFTGTDLVTGRTVAGGRTDLATALATLASGTYQESATATARSFASAIGLWVTPQDYGAVGDDSADDTAALNTWITRGQDSGKALFIPPGTYRTTTGLSLTSGAVGLRIFGASRTDSIIKNMSTTANALAINVGSAIESNITLENFAITTNTTSSGAGIIATNGNGLNLMKVNVAGHRTGFDVNGVSFAFLEDCLVTSTDGNAAGKGFRTGASATLHRCRATTVLGKAVSLEGAFSRALFCQATAVGGTGYDVTGADSTLFSCTATGNTTGFNVGAVARVGTLVCSSTDGTSDYTEASGATLARQAGNSFTTQTVSNLAGLDWFGTRAQIYRRSVTNYSGIINTSWTPDPTLGEIQIWEITAVAGTTITLTVNATATTGLVDNQSMYVILQNAVTAATQTVSWNAQYLAGLTTSLATSGGAGCYVLIHFIWKASSSKWIPIGFNNTIQPTAGGGIW